ncbi:MAG: Na+/melibiose symporter, partial [Verrucomicrobia bacterium]
AEHAPEGKRGLFTSWIQLTATLGFFLSLAVIYLTRHAMTAESFGAWGWRVPFLVSVLLLAISIYIRLKLEESPVFAEMKAQGKTSKAPLTESFARWGNAKLVLMALFGATAGQGVVWYTGQFYALYFLTTTLRLDYENTYLLIGAALLLGAPLLIFFGWLSDRIGRKFIMLAGCLLAVLTYQPIFHGLTLAANPALAEAMTRTPVQLHTGEFHGALDVTLDAASDAARKIIGMKHVYSETDLARNFLNNHGIPFELVPATSGAPLTLTVGGSSVEGFQAKAYEAALAPAGYPRSADLARVDRLKVIGLLFVLMSYVAMVYGPIAAFLVELFPTNIRYTSMSLPYHIGNGWFGGFLPLIAASIVIYTGNIYAGLWYPIGIAAMSVLVSLVWVAETKDKSLND